MHADTTTPVGMTDAFLTLFPVIVGLPRYCGVSAPSTAFRWLLSVHSRYGPHNQSERELAGADFHRRKDRAFQGTHNNICERAIRPVVMGRKAWLFAGSLVAGNRAAQIMSLLGTAVWSHMLG